MKTYYFIKSFLPLLFLPIAPGVLQVELARHGFLNYGAGATYAILLQVLLTLGIVAWVARLINRREEKSFLKMSCVSKKVFHRGEWMTVEKYLADYHNVVVSHGMTPEESTAWMSEAEEFVREQKELQESAAA